jgi:hypothetical protein
MNHGVYPFLKHGTNVKISEQSLGFQKLKNVFISPKACQNINIRYYQYIGIGKGGGNEIKKKN